MFQSINQCMWCCQPRYYLLCGLTSMSDDSWSCSFSVDAYMTLKKVWWIACAIHVGSIRGSITVSWINSWAAWTGNQVPGCPSRITTSLWFDHGEKKSTVDIFLLGFKQRNLVSNSRILMLDGFPRTWWCFDCAIEGSSLVHFWVNILRWTVVQKSCNPLCQALRAFCHFNSNGAQMSLSQWG